MDPTAKARLRACCPDEATYREVITLFAATYRGCGECRQRFRLLFDHAPIGITLSDNRHAILAANRSLCTLTGYTREQLESETMPLLDHPEDRAVTREILDGLWNDPRGPLRVSKRYRCHDGSTLWGNTTYTPVIDDEGLPLLMIAMVEDETPLRDAEAQAEAQKQALAQAEKMAALGTLVSGVAHEINNPNNVVAMNLSRLGQAWRDILPILDEYCEENGDFLLGGIEYSQMREALPGMVDDIASASGRIGTIVRDLLAYGRPASTDHVAGVDLNAVARRAADQIRRSIDQMACGFTLALTEPLPPVHGSPRRLEQVVVNLLRNACQACVTCRGCIRLETDHDPAAGTVCLRVRDRGSGMSQEVLARITEPFYTTKQGEGTGLGLWVSTTIVEEHGGRLEIASRHEEGTTATIILPTAIAGDADGR
ncbi:MAG: sensor histidine kinase [Planctomycetota bacterium]